MLVPNDSRVRRYLAQCLIPLQEGESPSTQRGFMAKPTKIPDALIRNICYPRAYRLPNLERMIWPPPKDAVPVVPYSYTGHFPALPPPGIHVVSEPWQRRTTYFPDRQASQGGPIENVPGNLNNEEYRFFTGRIAKENLWGHCRWCGRPDCSQELRSKHLLAGDCKLRLLDLYKEHRKTGLCAVCGNRTSKMCWGLRLCGQKCTNTWRFKVPDSMKFLADQIKKEFQDDASD